MITAPKQLESLSVMRFFLPHRTSRQSAGSRRTSCAVHWDERLTTVAAEQVLMESGVRREHRKEYVDQIAASMILQGYLDYRKNRSE